MGTTVTRRAFLGAAGLASLSLAACGGSNNSSSSDTSSGNANTAASSGDTYIYWLNFKPEMDETVQKLAKTYQDNTGIPIKVVTAASGTYEQTLTSEMDKSQPPTIFIIGDDADVKTWTKYFKDLAGTKIEAESNTDDYNLYDGDKLVGVGYCYECFGIIANPDLISQAGHDINAITDFASLKSVVEDIHSRASDLGFDAFAPADMDDSNSWVYTGHLANIDYFYEARGQGGWKECPPTITGDYLPNYKNLYDLIINNSTVPSSQLATGGHDPMNVFKTKKAAFVCNGSWEYAGLAEDVPNAQMIPYYCGVEGENMAGLNSGSGGCWSINGTVSEDDQNAADDFLVWLVTDKDASEALVKEIGTMPFTNSAQGDNPFLNEAEELTAADHYNMDWDFVWQPNVDAYRAGLVSALNQYNASPSDSTWEQFKTAFVQGWATNYQAVNG